MKPQITLQQTARRLEGDTDTPISLFLKNPQGILLESAEVDGRWGQYSVLASAFLLTLHCRDGRLALDIADERLAPLAAFEGLPFMEGLREVMRAVTITPAAPAPPPITRGLYGYLGYGVSAFTVARLARTLPVQDAEACLVLPGQVLLYDHLYNRLMEIGIEGTAARGDARPPVDKTPVIGEVVETPGREAYLRQVERIRDLLRQGEAIQVVLSMRCEAAFEGDPFALYRRLRQSNPSPYMFYMDLPGGVLMGASPELMIRCKANSLQLSPIAGTRPRGKTDEEDALLAADLLQDPKEHAEHLMLVDLGRNDLGRIAQMGTVRVDRQMEVERFSHVMHLTSRISAQLDPKHDAVDVIQATFPAGTVSGAPKVRAQEIIAEIEAAPRGPYAGCLGWVGLDKDTVNMDLGIMIRSLWIRDGKIHWQSGAGIVYDSVPEREYAECLNKAAVIRGLFGGPGRDDSTTGLQDSGTTIVSRSPAVPPSQLETKN
ncbi:MAG: anthranilate synthase component I family protein [Kiritimatiellaeota bacterium]|nr:anthranilate synthase component I family protein [Kiritimatiellota bacterium]